MKLLVLLILFLLSPYFTPTSFTASTQPDEKKVLISEIEPIIPRPINPDEFRNWLRQQNTALNPLVIEKVITTITCAQQHNVQHNNILTIIDYSLPSSEKRLWVFDLKQKKFLFHTYVSHGLKSGTLLPKFFSNKFDSKASSLGVYKTEETYYGREGLSLRLAGLERGFNDNAMNRYLVMHGGWYVDEPFIKKYGRAGRSWGCPALPENLANSVINTIKDQSLFVVYYPNEDWFIKSKFLNCQTLAQQPLINKPNITLAPLKPRESILFVNLHRKNYREDSEPVIVLSADNYYRFFAKKIPLSRMLRRQINEAEYIALSPQEFQTIIDRNQLNLLAFVVPVITMRRGYYATEMKMLDLGHLQKVTFTDTPSRHYLIEFDKKSPLSIGSTNQFIRWLGL